MTVRADIAQTPRDKPHSLALCGSCYCMTKRTRVGTCGKCGAKKPPHPRPGRGDGL